MNTIDLHVHSTCSDGTRTPTELVALASSIGLSAFALTDHDSTDGVAEALQASAALPEEKRPEVLPGIEFSTEYLGSDIHIVGLDMQFQSPEFQATVASFRDDRLSRNKKMIARMAADHIDISYEAMAAEYGEQVWTRAHFARYLVEHGYVASREEAFTSLIGEGCRYYVPRSRIRPEEAVDLIRRFDGIPILAHPMLYSYDDAGLRKLLARLKEHGLLGMEVYYSTHTLQQEAYVATLATEFGLLPSGGSDFHGANKPDISLGSGRGNLSIPCEVLDALREARDRARNIKGGSYDIS